MLLETQTSKGSVPNSEAKDVIIEEEEEIDVPYDTQLGFIIQPFGTASESDTKLYVSQVLGSKGPLQKGIKQ